MVSVFREGIVGSRRSGVRYTFGGGGRARGRSRLVARVPTVCRFFLIFDSRAHTKRTYNQTSSKSLGKQVADFQTDTIFEDSVKFTISTGNLVGSSRFLNGTSVVRRCADKAPV